MKRVLLLTLALLFSTTISAQLIDEKFDSAEMPEGWCIMGDAEKNWSISNTNKAGGDANEARLFWSPQFSGVTRLVTKAVDLTEIEGVTLTMKLYFENYSQNYKAKLGVATSSDNGTTWNEGWSQEYNIPSSLAGIYNIEERIATADMGKENVLFCIFFDGSSYNFTEFCFDNIKIKAQSNSEIRLNSIDIYERIGSGPLDIKFSVQNMGNYDIQSFEASYEDGYETVTETFTTSIPAFGTETFTFTDKKNILPGTYNLKVNILSVNGSKDYLDDNVLTKEINVALGSTQRMPMIEHFSSSACAPCANVNQQMKKLTDNNPGKYVYTKYVMNWPSPGDPYYTAEGGKRKDLYNINATPSLIYNGNSIGPIAITQEELDAVYNMPAFIELKGAFNVNNNTININVDVMPYINLYNKRLFISVNEKTTTGNTVEYGGNGENEFHHVMMKMLPNAEGTELDLKAGELQHFDFTYNMNGTFVEEMEDLEVAVWIQDNESCMEIFNSNYLYEYCEHPYPVENLKLADNKGTLSITWDAPKQGNPIAYNIYINNELVIENHNELSYSTMADGFTIVKVVAVYENGKSSVGKISTNNTPNIPEQPNYNVDSLDLNFGEDKTYLFEPSIAHDFMEKVLVQEDSKIITVGRARVDGQNYSVYVSRHNVDGSLDETYGNGGIVFLKAEPFIYMNCAFDADFDEDGNLYIAGYTFDGVNNTAFVICLDKNGNENEEYGDKGYVITEYGGGIVYEAIDVDSKGQAVVAGYLNDQILVRRYTAEGNLDQSFANLGTAIISFGEGTNSYAFDVKALEDGKILVTGYMVKYTEGYILKSCVLKLKSSGELDTSFGDGGTLFLYAGEYAEYALSISVQPNGKYLIAGYDELFSETPELPRYESFIVRINTDGTIDETFGTEGFVKIEPLDGKGRVKYCYSIESASDGQIFGAIYSYDFTHAYVFNLDINGQFKENFGDNGIMTLPKLADDELEINLTSLALQDNNLIAGGYIAVEDGYNTHLFLVRIATDLQAKHKYWTPDESLYANNMTIITTVEIDGVEAASTDIEIGAFCNGELRGSSRLQYVASPANRYECFLMVYGNAGDDITFRMYDHSTGLESELKSSEVVDFEVNGTVGDVINPYTIKFTSKHWIVDQSLYANNMTLIATLEIDGEEQYDSNWEIGAFCNGELRGSERLQYVANPADRYECFLMIYGNSGDNITFRLYDHNSEAESELTSSESISFEVNATIGDVVNPYTINFKSTEVHTQALLSGWNWYSTYIINEGEEGLANLEAAVGTNGIQIKNQTKFVNQASGNWYGTLKSTAVEDMFMIQLTSAAEISLEGYVVNPEDYPITLSTNWKWISYPIANSMSVEEAFASANPSNGDYVKSQKGFAQYYEGLGWTGTLKTMTPGMGYMYQNTSGAAKTFVYPMANAKSKAEAEVEENLHWTANATKYPMNMTVIAVVEDAARDYEVAAFSNGECRGAARPVYIEALGQSMIFMTIYGDDNDNVSFRYYDVTTGEEVMLNDEMTFVVNATHGDIMQPYVMTMSTMGIDEASAGFNIYPNPVQDKLYIETQTLTQTLTIEIYDVYGRRQDTETPSHQGNLSVDVSNLNSGIYFIQIKTEEGNIVKRFVKE